MKTYIQKNWPAIGCTALVLTLAIGVANIGNDPDEKRAMIKRCISLPPDSIDGACADWLRDSGYGSIEQQWRLNTIDLFISRIENDDSAREYEAELNQLYALRLRCATGDIEDCRAPFVVTDIDRQSIQLRGVSE